MQYHMALVHSLAAERNAKKSAASAALSRQLQPSPRTTLSNKVASRGYAGGAPAAVTPTGSSATAQQLSHKRRKLTEYTDLYMNAMYHMQQQQQVALASAMTNVAPYHPPTSSVAARYPTYEQQYSDHQTRMAAEDAAFGQHQLGMGSGFLPQLPPQQQLLLASLKEIYPVNKTSVTSNLAGFGSTAAGTAGSRASSPPPGSAADESAECTSPGSSVGSDKSEQAPSKPEPPQAARDISSGTAASAGNTSTESVPASTSTLASSSVLGSAPLQSPYGLPGGLPVVSAAGYPYSVSAATMGTPDAGYTYALQAPPPLYGGWSYGGPGAGYGHPASTIPPTMYNPALPPGLQGLSHQQILQYLVSDNTALLLLHCFTNSRIVPMWQAGMPSSSFAPAPSTAAGAGDSSSSSSSAGSNLDPSSVAAYPGGKLTLDEWLRAMQSPRSAQSANVSAGLGAYPGALYADPNYLMMMSSMPPPANPAGMYPPSPQGPPRQQPSSAQYLNSLYGQQHSALAMHAPYNAAAASALFHSQDMQTYNAMLSAASRQPSAAPQYSYPYMHPPSTGGTSAAAAAVGRASAPDAATGTGSPQGASQVNSSSSGRANDGTSREDAEAIAGGHSAAAEALMRLLNN
jgi:hypothetical protein